MMVLDGSMGTRVSSKIREGFVMFPAKNSTRVEFHRVTVLKAVRYDVREHPVIHRYRNFECGGGAVFCLFLYSVSKIGDWSASAPLSAIFQRVS